MEAKKTEKNKTIVKADTQHSQESLFDWSHEGQQGAKAPVEGTA